jgi:uncharacterized protein (TIGR00255 family)
MTGFGRAIQSFDSKSVTVELRSLNSKFTDVRLKIPQNYKEKEQEIKKIILDRAERGKVDVNIEIQAVTGAEQFSLNRPLFKKYVKEIKQLAKEDEIPLGEIIPAILRLPNVVMPGEEDLDEKEWTIVLSTLQEALDKFTAFRKQEGEVLQKDMTTRIQSIKANLEKIEPHEKQRIIKIKEKMMRSLEEFMGKKNVDKNRYEQEVLFYLEKIDINEEKVRLSQHCDYFLEQLGNQKTAKGRKLSFISQEIGREINTLGSKAYSSDIQRHVVNMKDELEKIKEQVANSV